jgi:CheY-like chemotaxis protein
MERSRILVVDDDDAVRIVTSEMLKSMDLEVECAESGRAALACLAQTQTPFDLVLLDVGMPVMDGVEVYENVHRDHPGQKVAFMTGYTDDISEFANADVTVLPKPFSMQNLSDLIHTIL